MPELQSKSIYRRASTVTLKDHSLHEATTNSSSDTENFHRFLNERVALPAEWSAPQPEPTRWNYQFTHNPPPLAPPFMPAMPSPEIPGLPSDWWHSDTNIRVINGTGDMWSGDRIPFFPNHGYCKTGISLQLARTGTGMVHADFAVAGIHLS
ncbi:hypothetical protein C8R43DRAFT_1113899 [Mycena crocata]|nr:hypothetical protein C8R43DRAFT_1113899 [Mycena crocata]